MKKILLLIMIPAFSFSQVKEHKTGIEASLVIGNTGVYLASEHYFKKWLSIGPYFSYQKVKQTDAPLFKGGGYINFTIKKENFSIFLGTSGGVAAINVGSSLKEAEVSASYLEKIAFASSAGNTKQLNLINLEYQKELARARKETDYIYSEVFDVYLGIRVSLNKTISLSVTGSTKDDFRAGFFFRL